MELVKKRVNLGSRKSMLGEPDKPREARSRLGKVQPQSNLRGGGEDE